MSMHGEGLFRQGLTVVGRVTRCADGRDSEALPEQAFAVHTHRIITEDILLRDLVST